MTIISITPLINKNDKIPVYKQVCSAIREEIESGKIKQGDRLPSVRNLAEYLNVSKNTVNVIYQQLIAEGYAESCKRSGVFVRFNPDVCPVPVHQQLTLESAEQPSSDLDRYDFYSGPIDTKQFPVAVWKKCVTEALYSPVKNSLDYGDGQGDYELREQIARYVFESRGIVAAPQQIVLFAGTQHAISMLCQLLSLSGEQVAMEDPGYRGVRVVFENHGCDVQYIPLAPDGIQVDALYATSSRVVYVTPSHQFPMGMVMPVQKRQHLLKWAMERNSFIIEDDYDSEFRYQSGPIPAMKALDYGDRVIYLGTLSKVFLPSARLSYIVLPYSLLPAYRDKLQYYNQSVSSLIQHALHLFMKEGDFAKHIRKMRRIYQTKHATLIYSIKRFMGDKVKVIDHNGGLHLLLKLPDEYSGDPLELALARGVKVEPLANHWAGRGELPLHCFIIGFGALGLNELEAGIEALAEAWFAAGK